jgi:putative membrane fusion protein
MKKKRISPVVIYIAAVIVLYVIIYIFPSVTGFLKPTYIARYGELKTYDETTGYIVRNEQVYFTGKSGNIDRLVKEGKLIRKGTRVMKVSGSGSGSSSGSSYRNITENVSGKQRVDTSDYVTTSEGVLTFYADGYESELTPANMEKKSSDFYRSLKESHVINIKRGSANKNEPVFKIADRAKWYIVCFVDKSHSSRYKEGASLRVKLGSTTIYGTVSSKKTDGDEIRLIIKTNYYYKNFARHRAQDVQIITSDSMGILIENSSIVTKNGQKGVYVRQKTGSYKFTPINVIDTDGTKSTVSSGMYTDSKGYPVNTVKTYDVIERRP